ncbi:hypothetical protein NIES4071_39240 [Calothrix sp. NIES-4071]|nr:hypothetical protein NIES4071_39240 [Calothrix sp. NIES-4071]BAZ58242.1 hypothetical protein NIES4105_39180 [Calothrix sp. NIES-4105]
MNATEASLRNEVKQLAEDAFHRKLISGYGDGPDVSEFQIVFEGKPRHFPLEQAKSFLTALLADADDLNELI